MASEIGSKAKIPNPALKPLSGLVGEWRTSGTHPALDGASVRGRASFAWQDGGAFLVWRSEIEDDPRFPAGIAIFGSDDVAGTLFISYFDQRGISRKYDVALDAGGFTVHRDDPKFSQRMTFTFEGNDRMVCRGEMSRDGGAWEADLSLTYERISG